MKGGIKWGVRLAAVTGFYTMTSTISTVYRNKVIICNQIIKQEGDVPIELACNSGIDFMSRWPL